MAEEKITIGYSVLNKEALEIEDRELVQKAELSMEHAHAPYSGFQVGCAVRMTDGNIVTGNNQENAAYPSGLCAERVALFAAKSNNNTSIDALVVVARNKAGQAADAFSCGNCRQVMMEYASYQSQPIRIFMQTAGGKYVVLNDVKELLPFHFNSAALQ